LKSVTVKIVVKSTPNVVLFFKFILLHAFSVNLDAEHVLSLLEYSAYRLVAPLGLILENEAELSSFIKTEQNDILKASNVITSNKPPSATREFMNSRFTIAISTEHGQNISKDYNMLSLNGSIW